MDVDCIPFRNTNYFSNLICDYLDESQKLKQFYHRFPSVNNFKNQIEEKKLNYPKQYRQVLVNEIKAQYRNLNGSEATLQNLHLLSQDNTFTITTGHQLNLFTGPLYFLYKIISTINLCKELNDEYTEYNFVPVYWMATEDHDFEEINYFNINGKKIHWNKPAKGPVGELSTDGLQEVFNLFSLELGSSKNAKKLENLFKGAYLNHSNLADATRFLANELFKDYGLVIIDANKRELKNLFLPVLKDELLNETSNTAVTNTNELLSEYANIQVNPREVNLFYLKENYGNVLQKKMVVTLSIIQI